MAIIQVMLWTGRFCWSQVLLYTCTCWWHLVVSIREMMLSLFVISKFVQYHGIFQFCYFSDHVQAKLYCLLYMAIFLLYEFFHLRFFHTHTHLMALFPGLPGWAGTRKVNPIWILLKQETVSCWPHNCSAVCSSKGRTNWFVVQACLSFY